MSFLRRLLGGRSESDAPAAAPSGAPEGPFAVSDPRGTLAEYIGRVLERPELEFLIVEWDAARNLYMQLVPPGAGGGVRAEVVGDRYLQPRDHLSEAQRAELARLGWQEQSGVGNWQQVWPADTEPAAIADVCAETMGVYGMGPRPQWTITFGAD